ncbi:FecR family protein [Candidatus Wolfebacteria bacterium]|nr:FecR family protein [Candidatus Wolfebacteria bacterium]
MKLWAKTVLALVVLLVAGGAWLLLSGDAETPNEGAAFPSRLTVLSAALSVRATSSVSFTAATSSMELFPGAIVRTDDTGRALIEAPGTSITVVGENTELTVAAGDAGRTALALHTGNLWSRIEKSLEQGEFYEIETQHAVAAVRGTSFGTNASAASTSILVTENSVDVIQKNPETGERLPNTLETVEAGSKATVSFTDGIIIEPLSPEDTSSEWFGFNNPDFAEPPAEIDTEFAMPPAEPDISPPPPLTLIQVNPSAAVLGEEDNIVLTGSGFTDVTEVFVGSQSIAEFFIPQDSTLYFDARLLNSAGTFDVSVVNAAGVRATLSDALSVAEPSPERESAGANGSEPTGTVAYPQGQQ